MADSPPNITRFLLAESYPIDASLRAGAAEEPESSPERLIHWRGGTGVLEMGCALE